MTNSEFMRLMFAGATGKPWVTSFGCAPAEANRYQWAGWAVRREREIPVEGNTYVTVSAFLPGEDGRYRRRKANFAAMHCVMIDDIGPKVAESAIALPFTVLVETSPDNCQGWLKLDPPITDRALAERLTERMIAAGLTADGRDPGMRGVTRYGRLPQGRNTKPRTTGPWLHRVVEERPALAYSVDEIAEAYGLDLSPPLPRKYCAPTGPIPDALAWLRHLDLYQGELQDKWHAITCPWVEDHSGGVDTGTAYREPAEENGFMGAFKCHHGHCQHRHIRDLFRFFEFVAREVA